MHTDPPDWPKLAADRDALLETGDGFITSCQFSAAGELLQQTDAMLNRQAFTYNIDGQLKDTRLILAGEGQVEKLLVSDIRYNVMGQIEAETAGNGVITRRRYDEANGRLTELSAHKANGTPLQVLKYSYDAVGNVLRIEDAAQPIRYFNNQRIEPIKTYRHDTLYQLIEATGCEAKTGQSGPALPDFHTLETDPSQIANYTQTYHYDAGGNLLDLVHLGAQAHGRTLTRARYSNRCLPERDNRPLTEEELAKGFDANGNLRELQAGQPLSWDLRNQLSAVQLIVRKNAEADRECYVYDGGGQRVRKINVSQANAHTLTREVRYLPGLEIRINSKPDETLHVITVSAGSNNVQVLHWVAKRPSEVPQDQVRYGLNDHLKSSALELDQNADLISHEWYYPFGGTAYWAGRNAIEAIYKTVRYSGKERDGTGLYYYGFRYYVPWLQRWINPDPAGYVDGMNLYLMVSNSPAGRFDEQGKNSENFNDVYLYRVMTELDKYRPIHSFFFTRKSEQQLFKKIKNPKDLSKPQDREAFISQIAELLRKTAPMKKRDMVRAAHPEIPTLRTFLVHAARFENFDPRPVESVGLPGGPQAPAARATPNTYAARLRNMQDSRLAAGHIHNDLDGHGTSTRRPESSRRRIDFSIVPVPLPQDTAVHIVDGYKLAIRIINATQKSDIFPESSESEQFETVRKVSQLITPRNLRLEGVPHVAEMGERALNIVKSWIVPQPVPRSSYRRDN